MGGLNSEVLLYNQFFNLPRHLVHGVYIMIFFQAEVCREVETEEGIDASCECRCSCDIEGECRMHNCMSGITLR